MTDDTLESVLVVDDNADAAAMLVELLRHNGYHARCASDGVQALRLVDERVPLCVLLDVQMPRLDGLELARRLRERFGSDIILIAMSGLPRGDARLAATYDLVDFTFTKPIDFAKLERILPPQR